MATEVSEEIKKRIEARRANRAANTAAPAVVAEPPVQPAEEVPPAVEEVPVVEPQVVEAAVPPAKPQRQPRLEPEIGKPEPPISRAERVAAAQPIVVQPAILSVLEGMRRGEAIVISRESDATWYMTSYAKFLAGPKPKTAPNGKLPNGFLNSLFSPEYLEWEQVWNQKDFTQKMEYAVEKGLNAEDFITEENGAISPRLTLLKLVPAVRNKLGLSKYKPGFETVSQRKEAEAKARAGEDWL